jgi:L-alanine-DL-glutamate epimerase-like enolase superfamily enzyme
MIGCGTESEISLAAPTHFAAATRNTHYADLDSGTLLRDRLGTKGGTVLEKSLRRLPETPGLGVEPLDARLLGKSIRIYK